MVNGFSIVCCNCDELNITCIHNKLNSTKITTVDFLADSYIEDTKRETEEKLEKLEKRREIEKSQHWKHKNKPKY